MDIFTINLDSRPDRWNRVMAIQRAFPWARFHRLPAVSIPMYTMGACTTSHQLAVLMALVEGMPSITVAEDDIEPTKHFEHWPAVVTKAETLGLDYVVGAVVSGEDYTLGANRLDGKTTHATGAPVELIEARNGRGTHLITYFASAYEKILDLRFGIPIDLGISTHPELRGGFAFPFVAVQGDGYSDLCHSPYGTSGIYLKAAERWRQMLKVRTEIDWAAELAPVVPVSRGAESVRRLTFEDLIHGRNPKPKVSGFPATMEDFLNGR